MKYCYHTHTQYCDGGSEPRLYIEKALELGFSSLGFSGHAPVPILNSFAIPENKLEAYCQEINTLKEEYNNRIEILLGLEIDYIPGISVPAEEYRNRCGLDYEIGSVHLVKNMDTGGLWFIDGPKTETFDEGLEKVFSGNIRLAVQAYFEQINEMIVNDKPMIIGHIDKIRMHNRERFFSESEEWYIKLLGHCFDLVKKSGAIVEINTRGVYKKRSETFFPSPLALDMIKERSIPIIISTDAHLTEELDLGFDDALSSVQKLGYTEGLFRKLRVYNIK